MSTIYLASHAEIHALIRLLFPAFNFETMLPQACNCGDVTCTGNRAFITIENGEEMVNVEYSHHKNESKSGQPIPMVTLPKADDLSKVLIWHINFGHTRLWVGTVVRDDPEEVGANMHQETALACKCNLSSCKCA